MKQLLNPWGFIASIIVMCALSLCGVPVATIAKAAGCIAITIALIWWGVRQSKRPDERARDSDGF